MKMRRGQQRGAGGRSGSGCRQRRGRSSRVRTAAAGWMLLLTGAHTAGETYLGSATATGCGHSIKRG
jgi:hypothetical protein